MKNKSILILIIILVLAVFSSTASCMETVPLTKLGFDKGVKLPSDEKLILKGDVSFDKRTKIVAFEYTPTNGLTNRNDISIDNDLRFITIVGPFEKGTVVTFDFYLYTVLDFKESTDIRKELQAIFSSIKTNFTVRHDDVYSNEQFTSQLEKLLLGVNKLNLYISKDKKLSDEILDKMAAYSGSLVKYGYELENKALLEEELKKTFQNFIEYNNQYFALVSNEEPFLKTELGELKLEFADTQKVNIQASYYKASHFISRILSEMERVSSLKNKTSNEIIFKEGYFYNIKLYENKLADLKKEYDDSLKIIVDVEELMASLTKIADASYSVTKITSTIQVKGPKEIANFNLNYIYSPQLEDFGSFVTLNLHAKRALREIYDLPLYALERFNLTLGRSIEAFGDGTNQIKQPVYYFGVGYNINEYFTLNIGNILYENDETDNKMRAKQAFGIGVDFKIIGELLKNLNISY